MFDMTPLAAVSTAPAAPCDARRPRLLMRAGRIGAGMYRRRRDLRAVLPAMAAGPRRACDVAARLRPMETELELARRAARPDYSPARHVAVLSALIAESTAAGAPVDLG